MLFTVFPLVYVLYFEEFLIHDSRGVSFMLFTVFPLVYVLYFEEFLIHDSRGFMILKNY